MDGKTGFNKEGILLGGWGNLIIEGARDINDGWGDVIREGWGG